MTWKYTKQAPLQSIPVVIRTNDDGSMESCIVTREDVQAWIAEGNTPEAADE
jgi:hypothetical protein